jgi:hypothetical protein
MYIIDIKFSTIILKEQQQQRKKMHMCAYVDPTCVKMFMYVANRQSIMYDRCFQCLTLHATTYVPIIFN